MSRRFSHAPETIKGSIPNFSKSKILRMLKDSQIAAESEQMVSIHLSNPNRVHKGNESTMFCPELEDFKRSPGRRAPKRDYHR